MNYTQVLKRIARADDGAPAIPEEEACSLFAAMLDGGVPDLELGALLAMLRLRPEAPGALLGFQRAVAARLDTLRSPVAQVRPIVIPAYGGARIEHDLLPLLGLLLRRLGVPVLFHGMLEGHGRVACVYILRELGIMPSLNSAQAQKALDDELLAYVPIASLSPGLANLLALRNRLGVRNAAHTVAKLIDPFEGHSVRLVSASTAPALETLAAVLQTGGGAALLLRSTEGEPFADPRRRPQIDLIDDEERTMLFDEEAGPVKPVGGLPSSIEANATAAWTRQALAGEVPIPHPLVNQLACCLYASRYTENMNQAKAIAAVETGSLGPVGRRRGPANRTAKAAAPPLGE